MFLRILSKESWFRGLDGEKIKPLKRKTENQKVLCFKNINNQIQFEEKEIEIKMITKSTRTDDTVKQKMIATENGNDIIFADISKENNLLTINDEGQFESVPFDLLREETSLVCYEDLEEDRYTFSDITITETFNAEITEENGGLANHIFFIPDGYGVIVNDFLIN